MTQNQCAIQAFLRGLDAFYWVASQSEMCTVGQLNITAGIGLVWFGLLFFSAFLSAIQYYYYNGSGYGKAPDPSTSGHYLVIRTSCGDYYIAAVV